MVVLTLVCHLSIDGNRPTMDNLVFYSKVSEGNHISVGTVNRNNKVYESEITDFKSIQQPTAFLVDAECRELLLTSIKKVTYQYDETIDQIIIKLPVYDGKYISCALCHKIPDETDLVKMLEQRVNFLESVIDRLEPYELIHEDKYPTWSSLDEFKALDCYRYIKASDCRVEFYRNHNILACNDEECRKSRYNQDHRYYHGELNGIKYLLDCNNNNWNFRKFITMRLHKKDGTECKKDSNEKHTYRKKSVRYIHYQYSRLNWYIAQFIYDYFTGWCLSHSELIAFREPYCRINIHGDNVLFTFHRLKKQKILSYDLCPNGCTVFRSGFGQHEFCIDGTRVEEATSNQTAQLSTIHEINKMSHWGFYSILNQENRFNNKL